MILSGQPVHVYTDHRNLLYIIVPSAGRYVMSKVQRWATYLSRFEYVLEHVDGDQNIFADIITRWMKGYRYNKVATGRVCSFL